MHLHHVFFLTQWIISSEKEYVLKIVLFIQLKTFSFTAQVLFFFLKSYLIVQVLCKSTFESLKYWLNFRISILRPKRHTIELGLGKMQPWTVHDGDKKGLWLRVFISFLLFHFYHELKLNYASLCKSLANGCGLSVNLYFYNINVLNHCSS